MSTKVLQIRDKEKRGGPYTKQDQEHRRLEVYRLYFEEGKSAVKIAEMLNVNRNTVNEDIKFWHSQLAHEIGHQDLGSKLLEQIHRLELQRSRLLEELDKLQKFEERIVIEKMLFEIDSRLAQIFTKIAVSKTIIVDPDIELHDISENDIKEFVRDLILKNDAPDAKDIYTENKIEFEFIRKTKCEKSVAENIIQKMIELGLYLCEENSLSIDVLDFSQRYNLGKFANLRDYITIDEFAKITRKRQKIKDEIERLEKEREENPASNSTLIGWS